MNYMKNEKMEYMSLDGGEEIVFDPESGNTHFLDQVGTDIINILDKPKSIESIIDELSKMYEADKLEMESDVKEFMSNLLEKQVVVRIP
jgi:PqqD family protein of HPr-rel-A system